MNKETFSENFELLADTSNGVQKLRELILKMAVQGKLLPQDSHDEPTSILLEKIKLEKKRLLKEGKIKKLKYFTEINEDEVFFNLPIGWEWARLNDLGIIFNGNSVNSHKKNIYSQVKKGLPYVATKDIGYGSLDVEYDNSITIPFGEPKFKIAHDNSILICSEGGSAGRKIALINRDIYFGNKLFANETFNGVLPKYVFYLYQSRFFRSLFKEKMTGIIGGISLFNFLSLVVPLPPFEEQKRIVTKVDQLMALCDQLEARQQKKHEQRILLNNAALDKLLTAPTPDEFTQHWQCICNNFDLLYDAPETVRQLRQAIRQLAVQGKLVAQDPEDEPAAVLLEKIKTERKWLIKEKIIKKSKPLPEINVNEIPFNIPRSWKWIKLGNLCYKVADGPHYSPKYVSKEEGVPFLSARNIKIDKFELDSVKYVSFEDHLEFCKRVKPEKGDILYTKGGTTGVALVNDLDFDFSVWVHLAVLQIAKNFVDSYFLSNALNSPLCYEQSQAFTHGSSNRDLGLTRMVNIMLPLPPLEEQKRIVAKVDQLMALCNELQAGLVQAQTDGGKLMEAIVHHVLAG